MTKTVIDLQTFETKLLKWATEGHNFNVVRSRTDIIADILKDLSKVEFDPEEGYTFSFYIGTDVSSVMRAGWNSVLVLTKEITPSLHIKTNFNGIVIAWGFS